jgi:hypothetical protein
MRKMGTSVGEEKGRKRKEKKKMEKRQKSGGRRGKKERRKEKKVVEVGVKKSPVFFVCVPCEASEVQRQANQRAHLAPKWYVAHNSSVFFSFFLFVAPSTFCIAYKKKDQVFFWHFSVIINCVTASYTEGYMSSMTRKPWLLFALLIIMSYYRACFSIAGDTLSPGHSLSGSKTILSQSSNFELGFFKPGTTSKIYLGIWYRRFYGKDSVWVANRENPLSDLFSPRLDLSEDGNLLLFEGSSKIPVWSTNLTFPRSNLTEAVLRDDGNFVLRDKSNTSCMFWESFNHPTDTLLPGAKLGIDKVTGKPQQLISWKNKEDPSPGVFSLGLDPNGSNQFFIEWNRSQIYWSSGLWNGTSFSKVHEAGVIFNFTFVSSKNESERYFTYTLYTPSNLANYRIGQTGQIKALVWLSGLSIWNTIWSEPRSLSDVYALCGAFGVLQYPENFSSPCECLTGFEPSSMEDTRLNDWSRGCVRKSPLQCEDNTHAIVKQDWFMKISNMQLPVYSKTYLALNASRCELACMENCSCTAYAYNRSGCMIWEGALFNLLQFPHMVARLDKISTSDLLLMSIQIQVPKVK